MSGFSNLLQKQKAYFESGATLDVSFRKARLKELFNAIKASENEIHKALTHDLQKPFFESWATETGLVLSELRHQIRNIEKWSKPARKPTNLVNLPGSSFVIPEPYGRSLIISTWNYPLQLLFMPLAGALAAGNTAVLKPSEHAPALAKVAAALISKIFPEEYVAVVNGDASTSKLLLEEQFEFIFFTGSIRVGKLVMEAAAKNLTPLCLELGGKNPCIVDQTADIDISARRICWGKFINAGQTCVAPDHVYVHASVKEKLQERLIHYIRTFYGENPPESRDFMPIINEAAFKRLEAMLGQGRIVAGGQVNRERRMISPCLVTDLPEDSYAMKEEIFGPVLPIIGYSDPEELFRSIRKHPKPLALYVFSDDRKFRNRIIREIPSGGCAINDTVMHMANPNLPFGGVQHSGMGAYHGKHSFDLFSHKKAVLKKPWIFDLPLRYPPYSSWKEKWIRRLLK